MNGRREGLREGRIERGEHGEGGRDERKREGMEEER